MDNQRKILATICILIAILITTIFIVPKVIKHMNLEESYYEVEKYHVKNSESLYYTKDLTYIVESQEEYEYFLSINNIKLSNSNEEEIQEKDYDNFNYVLVLIPTSDCNEDIELDDVEVHKDRYKVELFFTAEEACGLCTIEYELYEITVPTSIKSYYKVDTKWDIEEQYCNPDIAYKPILYIYPEKTTNIKVSFAKEENLTTTYPKFNQEWNITAHPNGDLYDSNNNYYYALYWEEKDYAKVDFNTGFYVSKENAINFLEEKLTILGLNPKERNEFIMYWLPILEKNEHNLVYFELTDELQKQNELIINPKPDTLIRIRMHVKKVDKKTNIQEPQLVKQERNGYIAIEWGGVIHN